MRAKNREKNFHHTRHETQDRLVGYPDLDT